MKPSQHFVKFFRQLPGLSSRELMEEDWESLLAIEDRIEFRFRVDELFPVLSETQRDRMAQFLYDKNQELMREAREEEELKGKPGGEG
jgi:hypothetical protein